MPITQSLTIKTSMKIIYAHDNVYYYNTKGQHFSAGQFGYDYWQPYREAFGGMTVLGRGHELAPDMDTGRMVRSDGDDIRIKTFKDINSVGSLLKNSAEVKSDIIREVRQADGVIIRAMSEIGWIVFKEARRLGLPIAHELSGCPWDNTWNHGSLIGKFYAPIRYLRARQVAAKANGVIYVTRDFLPKRYPANGFTAVASNVRIQTPSNDVLEKRLEKIGHTDKALKIGLIGQLDHKLKGIDIALKAIADFKTINPSRTITLHLLGPGTPSKYAPLIKNLGLKNSVVFDGVLPSGEPVFDWLDDKDIYIQPSFHEGLPRALIEAMSRGCPCLASTAGGIAELLPQDFLHKPGNHAKLAKDMDKLAHMPVAELKEISKTNFKTSLRYTSEKLVPIRQKFWKTFADIINYNHAR